LALLIVGACNNDTPATPTQPDAINLTGRWRGDIIYAGSSATMQWTLTQNGSAVTGDVLLTLPSGTVLLNGKLTGTLTQTTMPITIAVPAGAIPARPACTGTIAATMYYNPFAVPTLNGLLSVTQSTCPIDLAAQTGLTVAKVSS
jgi:hypothetical protein